MKFVKQMQYMNIFFDEQKKILFHEWTNGNEDIDEDELKKIISEEMLIIEAYSPIYFVADDSNRKCIFTVEVQNWMAPIVTEIYIRIGLQALAVIFPNELIAHLSTEQAVDEVSKAPFQIKYFNDKNAAIEWIRTIEKLG